MEGLALISGLGLGAALMYVLDPEGGNRRRALIRDKTVSWARRTGDTLAGSSRHLANRAKGFVARRWKRSAAPSETAERAHERAA